MTKPRRHGVRWLAILLCALSALDDASAGSDPSLTLASQDNIVNTRHNLVRRKGTAVSNGSATAREGRAEDPRSEFLEVCVFCHTRHVASTIEAPLWNRTQKATSYPTYDDLDPYTANRKSSRPGPASLTCLACHDGQTAVDSINGRMRVRYDGWSLVAPEFVSREKKWEPDGATHADLDPEAECLSCHQTRASATTIAGSTGASSPASATIFGGGDHPVGVLYPTFFGPTVDFKPPTATRSDVRWFDTNRNGRLDNNEVRLYDSGEGYEVECASCHDAHGGSGSWAKLLRTSNAGSTLCLVCHTK